MRRPPTPPSSAPPMVTRAVPPPAVPSAPVAVAPTPPRWAATNGSAETAKAIENLTTSSRSLTFHGAGGTLFGIYIVNVLLTLATLGWYRFWGKVRVRNFMLSQTSFEGDRFAYHGTGKELLLGFFKALLFVGLPITVLGAVAELSQNKMVFVGIRIFTSVLLLVFIPVAIVGAWRYRLSRTSWRGIRFSFRGRASAFVKVFVEGSLLSMLTLSLYYPFFQARQQRFMISQTHFGRRPFRFDGRGRDLFGAYLLTVLLFLPTLGLYTFWFQARKTRYFWEHTFFEAARFRCTVTGRQLMNLTIGNWVILLVTLGLAWPWVVIRSTKFVFGYLTLAGPLDLDGIVQEPQLTTATGDALSSLLGADVDFA
jgi:uncharacterized membrane protein YjgN (DUF898 family)